MTSPLLRRFLVLPTATSLVVTGLTPALAGDAATACPASGTPEAGFRDTAGTAHEANIDCVALWGIARGTSGTTYSPAVPVSRAQLATFLARTIAEARALPVASDRGFQDVRGTSHEDRINQLASLGVVHGIADDAFGPGLDVSRGQMATFLVRGWEAATGVALQWQGTRRFADTDGTAHADNADIAFEMGWSSGDTAGNFNPNAPVSRAAMASFLARFLEDLAVGDHIGEPGAPRLEAFEVQDADGNNVLGDGDSLALAYNKAMQANSSITLRDADGDETVVDDEAFAGVVDGRTAATLSGNGTDTLVFTLVEAPDVTGTGNGVLDGTITIVAQEGISSTSGADWQPAEDPAETTTEPVGDGSGATPPAAGGSTGGGGGGNTGGGNTGGDTGGGGGGTEDPTAPATFTAAFTDDVVTQANHAAVVVAGTTDPGVMVDVQLLDGSGRSASATTTADAGGDWAVTVDARGLADGTLTMSAVATHPQNVTSTVTTDILKDATGPAASLAFEDEVINQANEHEVAFGGVTEPGATLVLGFEDAAAQAVAAELVELPTEENGGRWRAVADVRGTHAVGELWAWVLPTDALGNRGTGASATVARDAAPPSTPTVAFTDELVNGDNAADLALTGTADAAEPLEVVVQDAAGRTASGEPVRNGSGWTLGLDVTGLADGALTAWASSTDEAGNTSTSERVTIQKDATAPSFVSSGVPNETTVTFVADEDLDTTGLDTSAPENRHITTDFDRGVPAIAKVEVTDARTIVVTFGGPIPDGGTVTLAADAVSDAAGNQNRTSSHVISPVVAPTLDALPVVNLANVEDVPLTGAAPDGDTVEVTLRQVLPPTSTETPASVTTTAAVADGRWATTNLDASTVPDGEVEVVVRALAGRDASEETEPVATVKDTVAPTVTASRAASGSTTAAFTTSEALDPATIDQEGPTFDDVAIDAAVPDVTHVTWADATATLTVTFGGQLPGGGTIRLLDGAMTDLAGNPLAEVVREVDAMRQPTIDVVTDPINAKAAAEGKAKASGTAAIGDHLTVTMSNADTEVLMGQVVAEDGTWELTLADAQLRELGNGTATVQVVASNGVDTATSGPVTTLVDLEVPDTVTDLAFVRERFSDASAVELTGTAEPGASVEVTLDDEPTAPDAEAPAEEAPTAPDPTDPVVATTTADPHTGRWNITIDASSLADPKSEDDQEFTATARVIDLAGNPSPVSEQATGTYDASPVVAPSVAMPTTVGAGEDGAVPMTIAGQAGSVATITSATEGWAFTKEVPVSSEGSWSGDLDLTDAPQGTVTVTVVLEEASGRISEPTTASTLKDTEVVATTVAFDAPYVNSGNQDATTLRGVGEPGAAFTLSIEDEDEATDTFEVGGTVGVDGTWSVEVDLTHVPEASGTPDEAPAEPVEDGLADGTLTATVVTTDGAGNTATAETTTVKATIRPVVADSGGPVEKGADGTDYMFSVSESTVAAADAEDFRVLSPLSADDGPALAVTAVTVGGAGTTITVTLNRTLLAGEVLELIAESVADQYGNTNEHGARHAGDEPWVDAP